MRGGKGSEGENMKKELSFEDQKAEITAVADRVGKSGKILKTKTTKKRFSTKQLKSPNFQGCASVDLTR